MNTTDIITATKQLIAFPSTGDNPAALKQAVDFVASIVSQVDGVTVERFESNGKHSFIAYRGQLRPEKFDILLNAHVDVVPGNPEQFRPYQKDGKLYGRGALDMKGTTMVLTDAFCQLVNEVPYALGLQIVSDEEIGGYDGVALQIKDGVRANFVIMGEYANQRGTIYNAARGLCWAEIAFKGKTAHGGHLWHGTNAVVKAGEFATAVLKRFPKPEHETWTTTASIAHLSTTNDTFNKVPDSAVMKIDFRFTQEEPIFRDRASVEAFVKSIDPEAEIIGMPVFEPSVFIEESNPYLQGLQAAMEQTTGQAAIFGARPAASDGRHYALVQNDIIEFGLNGGGSHSDGEYVELDSFAEYHAVISAFLRNPIPATLTEDTSSKQPLAHTLLSTLVGRQTTVASQPGRNHAVTYVADYLEQRGMHVERFEHNGYASLVATTREGTKAPAVMLNAHLDVVPAPADMFVLTERGGNFVGRGVMDMKFAVASYMALVDKLQSELTRYDFGIMITTDEEIGGANGTRWLLEDQGYRSKMAFVPDSGANWQLETFAKGVQWIKVEAAGKPSHASRPWVGDNAIKRLLATLHEIQTLAPSEPAPEDTTLSIGTIEGGTTANLTPTSASAMIDVRTGSTEDHEKMFPDLLAICEKHGVQATLVVSDPPCINDPQQPYLKTLLEIVTAVTGKQHEPSYSYGATDGRFFSAAGIPCAIIAPEAGGHHTDDEWLSVQGFDQFCEVIERYVRQVASTELNPTAGLNATETPQASRQPASVDTAS